MCACILGICGAVLVLAGLATNRLEAEEERRPRDETQRYLEKYSQFVVLLQEARFKYVGARTRSTPNEGVAGRWEESGTLSISAAQRSYHLTSVTNRVHPGHEDLGGRKTWPPRNDTWKSAFQPRIKSRRGNGGITFRRCRRFAVMNGRNWRAIIRWESLVGFVRLDGEERSLLEICELAAREPLPDQAADSKHLVGFVAKSDSLEVRAPFDPANQDHLTELRISRRNDKSVPAPGDLTSVSLSILKMPFTDGRPSSIKLKTVRQYAGGLLDLTRSGRVVAKPSHAQIEPQTWEFNYQVDQFDYAPEAAWFTLENTIPNGTSVTVEGLPGLPVAVVINGTIGGTEYTSSHTPDLELYWKDDRLTARHPVDAHGAKTEQHQ